MNSLHRNNSQLNQFSPTPLYLQIADTIKENITTGHYKHGDKIPSQREIAEHYDVSLITVQKAVYKLMNEGILRSRPGVGTFVNPLGNFPGNREDLTFGLIVDGFKNPISTHISDSIEEQVNNEKLTLFFATTHRPDENGKNPVKRLLNIGVDGLIIVCGEPDPNMNSILSSLQGNEIPCVVISDVRHDGIYHVGTDHITGAYMATNHLIEHGYEQIGYVLIQDNVLSTYRKRGYTQSLAEANIKPSLEFMISNITPGYYFAGYEAGKILAGADRQPEAMLLMSDIVGFGFRDALAESNIRIPEDIAILAFCDFQQHSFPDESLSVVRQPVERIGRIAYNKLMELICDRCPETQTLLEPELILGSSCGQHVETEISEFIMFHQFE